MEEEILEKLLNLQKNMQIVMYSDVNKLSKYEQLLINTRALIHEVIEVEDEVNWKHWKNSVPVNEGDLKNEIVDCFIFLMNIINLSGMDSNELVDRAIAKMDVNIVRQLRGY